MWGALAIRVQAKLNMLQRQEALLRAAGRGRLCRRGATEITFLRRGAIRSALCALHFRVLANGRFCCNKLGRNTTSEYARKKRKNAAIQHGPDAFI